MSEAEDREDYSQFEPIKEHAQPKPELTDDERYEESLRLPQGTISTNQSTKSKKSRRARTKGKGDYKPWQAHARVVRRQKQTVITAWDDDHDRAIS